MAKATHVSCEISGLLRLRQTIRRSVWLRGDAHALPIEDRRRTPSILTLTILSNNDWHYKQVQYNTQTRIWGQRPCTSAANLAAASPPTSSQEKSQAHCQSEIGENKLHTRRTQLADSSLGPMFQQQALLKKSCQHKIPQLGRRPHHPRLDSFVPLFTTCKNPKRNVLNEPSCPWVVSPFLPKRAKSFPQKTEPTWRSLCTDILSPIFFQTCIKKWLSFFSFQRYQNCNRRSVRTQKYYDLTRTMSILPGMRDFKRDTRPRITVVTSPSF